MPRARSPERDKAFELFKASDGQRSLVDIAQELGVPDAQVRKWKSTDKWEQHMKGIDPIQSENKNPQKRTNEKDRSNSKTHNGPRVFINGEEIEPESVTDENGNEQLTIDVSKHRGRGKRPLWNEMDMPSKLNAVRGWCMQGSTNDEICNMLGISASTFYKWQNEYYEFAEAVKRGKDIANGELLNAAFQQATGFRYTEQIAIKVRKQYDRNQYDEEVRLVEIEKFSPPDHTMLIFMMKNRMSDQYKDKHEVGLSGEVKNTHEQHYHITQEIIEKTPDRKQFIRDIFGRNGEPVTTDK